MTPRETFPLAFAVGVREWYVGRPESRSILSVGMEWASRVTAIGLEFALPPLLGSLGDRAWGTAPWLTVLGAFLGFAVGMMHILRIAREESPS